MKNNVIIVAGGMGSRMQGSLPKQFIELGGLPVLMHTIKAFFDYDSSIEIIVVLPKDHATTWASLIDQHNFPIHHTVTSGGKSRTESVKNGLVLVQEGLVAIHDGARPMVSSRLIVRCFDYAHHNKSAIPALPLKSSLRIINKKDNRNSSVNRDEYVEVQTPQVFAVSVIKKAYELINNNEYTDDASVLESTGMSVGLVEGDYENLKITTPIDLIIAESILAERK